MTGQKKLIRNVYTKNININVQWKRFPHHEAENSPRWFDIPLKWINQPNRTLKTDMCMYLPNYFNEDMIRLKVSLA